MDGPGTFHRLPPGDSLDALLTGLRLQPMGDAVDGLVRGVDDALDLGSLFFHFELAVAVAGAVIGINAFDQPNVQSAKDLTVATIDAYVRDGAFPAADAGGVGGEAAAAALRELLDAGVDQVSLFEGDRKVYGPMSLHPPG